jgi:hypothetical protein
MSDEKPSMGTSNDHVDDTNAIRIGGFSVLFPDGKKPFPAQLAVISKVLQALREKKNALLESPTGTGKVSELFKRCNYGFELLIAVYTRHWLCWPAHSLFNTTKGFVET